MYINDHTAKEIIKEICPFIPYDLNIMDGQGLILASTNPHRVGTHHEGAKILIQSSQKQLIVKDDYIYKGCKTGVNLPIYYAGVVIGVVGITGDPDETIKYGQIIQKMTEMLIYESLDTTQKLHRENIDFLYMSDIIYGNLENSLFNLEEWMNESGIKSQGPFTISVISLKENGPRPENPDIQKVRGNIIKNYVINYLKNKLIICASDSEHYICLSNHDASRLQELLLALNQELTAGYETSLLATIGNCYHDFLDISKSYNEALLIHRHFSIKDTGVYCFETIILEFVLNQIPEVYKKNLFSQAFQNCPKENISEYIQFIQSYMDSNGSLIQLADSLFVHKNTVQYKLNKISKVTGYDPRNYKDLFFLYLACSVYTTKPTP